MGGLIALFVVLVLVLGVVGWRVITGRNPRG